jgi:hypothetical protein
MKHTFLTANILIFGIVFTSDKAIQMPSTADLQKKLHGFEHFIEATNLVQNLANQKVFPLHVHAQVGNALVDYEKYFASTSMSEGMKNLKLAEMYDRKDELIKTILQEHADAIEDLKNCGILR